MIGVVFKKTAASATARFRFAFRRFAAPTTSAFLKESPEIVKENFAQYWSIFGALAGMAVNLSAILNQRPDEASVTMSRDLCVIGSCLVVWSYRIAPTNISLVGCHVFNVITQLNLLRQRLQHRHDNGIRILQPNCSRQRRKGEIDPNRRHRHQQ
jgi:hypothetical protein